MIQYAVLLTVEAGAAPVVRTLLPTFQVVLLINLGTRVVMWPAGPAAALATEQKLVGSALLGPLKSAWHYQLAGGARVLAVSFTLAGFYRLFQVLVDRFGDGLLDPDTVVRPACFAELRERLLTLAHPAQLMRALTACCRPYLHALEAP